MANWTPNETQKLFLETLAKANEPLTLAEIGAIANTTFKTGAINPLTTKGLIICNNKAKEIVCACCGHKTKVSTYELVKNA